ncbi:MAG: hypothetical protein AMJ89_02655 [candidate division Zixibacteria bacterium SM23_73]|nr:MAG: hypothetical protein AMJ89_02655 [candidate division Zixibacteria bacterium SM23_73]
MDKNIDQSGHYLDGPKRISIYIYPAQMQMIERICETRRKTKRWVFFEAIQSYIGAYTQGKV